MGAKNKACHGSCWLTYLATTFALAGCVPYSQAACEAAVDRLGLKKDENFVLTSSCADIMGCMAYNGRAWYRPGGTESQIKSNADVCPGAPGTYRPKGYDCS